jgi:hypothetical protein
MARGVLERYSWILDSAIRVVRKSKARELV